jgi:hypothetical protein
LKFLLDENVLISIKDVIRDLGFDTFTIHDFNMFGIQNGEVAKLAVKFFQIAKRSLFIASVF